MALMSFVGPFSSAVAREKAAMSAGRYCAASALDVCA
jgi:4'-phosphopantetheinyl transferase EntD